MFLLVHSRLYTNTNSDPDPTSPPIPTSRAMPMAPAMLQFLMSSPARVKAVERGGEASLNTQSLRCRHNVQAPKMTRELNPFLRGLSTKKRCDATNPQSWFLKAAELRHPAQITLGGETRTAGRRRKKRGDG
jgi:hypothetical protein